MKVKAGINVCRKSFERRLTMPSQSAIKLRALQIIKFWWRETKTLLCISGLTKTAHYTISLWRLETKRFLNRKICHNEILIIGQMFFDNRLKRESLSFESLKNIHGVYIVFKYTYGVTFLS